MAKAKTDSLLTKYQTHVKDTGSAEIQIILLSEKIQDLSKHLRSHDKDYDSRVGLLKMIGKRRRLLDYLNKTDPNRYKILIKDLKLKR